MKRHHMKLWTDDDDAALTRAVVAGFEIGEIADEIGRTPPAIRNRAYVLRLKLGKKRDPAAAVTPVFLAALIAFLISTLVTIYISDFAMSFNRYRVNG